jgi:hypothetical protein
MFGDGETTMCSLGYAGGTWVRGSIGRDAATQVTRTGYRTVLLMVPTMTAGTRLLDLVPLLESDLRLQLAISVPHMGHTWQGVDEFVRGSGILVVPWQQATQHDWDLVLTASHRHIDQVHGKVLVLPHGAGATRSRLFSRKSGGATRPTTGLDSELLTYRGRLIPSALALSHDAELDVLRGTCPEAEPVAVVAGDICLDRMTASLPLRDRYRACLEVTDGTLITISSTWSTDSTLGVHPDLYGRLLDELRQGNVNARVAAVLHPAVWAAHGQWQVRSWLAAARRDGLLVVPPEEGWRAVMIASDVVIGDHGSTTAYAAAIGRPVCLTTMPSPALRPGSIAATLASRAPVLDHGRPLLPQLRGATVCAAEMAGMITSRAGRAAHELRDSMYRLLGLDVPPWPAQPSPIPLPCPDQWR